MKAKLKEILWNLRCFVKFAVGSLRACPKCGIHNFCIDREVVHLGKTTRLREAFRCKHCGAGWWVTRWV